VLLQPIELLKTRVQQSGHHSLRRSITELRTSPTGLAGLWRGTLPSALRTGLGSAVYFTSLNAIRQQAARVPSLSAAGPNGSPLGSGTSSALVRLSSTGNLLAGAAARTFAGFLLMPLTVLKVRYESSLYAYRSLASASRDIYAAEGLRGFFAGFGATALRDAPYAGLYVLFYERAKGVFGGLYAATGGAADGTATTAMGVSRAAAVNLSSSLVAATTCSVVSNPFDAVKTRIQLQPDEYRNIVQAAGRMYRERGLRAFMDGLALRMSRKAVSSALAWTVYEELIRRAEVGWTRGKAEKGEREDVL
jgi:solute carrier family 25, member 38